MVETVIASSEMNKDEITETAEVIDDFEDLDIPFEIIEDVPIFPGCEKWINHNDEIVFKKR